MVIVLNSNRWKDRREVLMLNSFLPHSMENFVSNNPNNTRQKPKSVLLYNSKMGGVDYIDQTLAPYESLRKSLKWYKKLAFHLIDLAVYNSYIVWKHYNSGTKLVFKDFLANLIREILKKNQVSRKILGRPKKSITTSQHHWPMKMLKENGKPSNSNCSFCKMNGKRKATPFACKNCGKRLCIDGQNSCFKEYHSKMTANHDSQTDSQFLLVESQTNI